MKIIKWTIAILVLAAIVYYGITEATKCLPVRTAKATKGKIYEFIEERAKTSLPHTYHLAMPLDGRIMPISLKEGTLVKKGQVVAQMDESDLKTRIAAIEAQCQAIKGEITINQFNAIETTALKETKDWVATLQALVAASQKKVDASKSVLKYAQDYEKTLAESGAAISRIKKSESQKDSAVAQVDVEIAQMSTKAMELLHNIFKLGPTYINEFLNRKNLQKKVLESRLAETLALLDKANRDLKRTKIVSPVDGVILKRYVSNERVLTAGMPLLDIGNLDQLEVTADILSQEVIAVKVGNSVDIFGPAIGNKPIKGTVTTIKPKGFTKVSSLGVEQQRVHVIIKFQPDALATLKKEGKSLGDGYRVRVKVYTASSTDGTIVPRTALFKGNQGNWELFKISDGKAILTNVEVGLINDQSVQILKGIGDSDSVIVAPPVSLTSGTKVKSEQ